MVRTATFHDVPLTETHLDEFRSKVWLQDQCLSFAMHYFNDAQINSSTTIKGEEIPHTVILDAGVVRFSSLLLGLLSYLYSTHSMNRH
jgi:hypothetical protein